MTVSSEYLKYAVMGEGLPSLEERAETTALWSSGVGDAG